MGFQDRYDVIVVGGGHAGTEAALAAARMGANTLLVSHNVETLGQMSCNPAIGGIGKTHLVKEIDALGGAMAHAADLGGIQFRVLNASKGPAVRATRAQADRLLYKAAIRRMLESQVNLNIFQQAIDDLIVTGDTVQGVVTQMGQQFFADRVVLTTGTFLGGKIHIGLNNYSGGRAGDPPSIALADRLRELPLRVGRLKTGTPPRIDARTVDFAAMQEQPGDLPLPVMSYLGKPEQHPRQISCYITATNEKCHDIIRAGLDQSPMYTGVIEGIGPRYCPSIEDKVVRFADKTSHQIFVEPEGLTTHELYPNGISTSLPFETQKKLIAEIRGFESAHIIRPGYAIEYDYFDPRDLQPSLETRHIKGLYFAGQINGTTGYEEAAAQGLLAGINAALAAQGRQSWCPRRDESYIGVLVDDLITQGTKEPYRMFTSRAEYRLMLRQDNADFRLTETGRKLGLVDDVRWQAYCEKREQVEKEQQFLFRQWVHPQTELAQRLEPLLEKPISHEYRLSEILARPDVNYAALAQACLDSSTRTSVPDPQVSEQVEIGIKYRGYIDRQLEEIEKLKRHEDTRMPDDFDYRSIPGLSNELRQKLTQARPDSIGRASRIPGITPAAISLLLVYLKKHQALQGRGQHYQQNSLMTATADSLGEALSRGASALGLALPDAKREQLLGYLAQLQKWNKAYNLSGIRDPQEMLTLHLLDSLSLVPFIDADEIADVGTGAGLPGIPLAIIYPQKHFILLDSNSKKTRFIFQTAALLGLQNIEVVHSRAEDYERVPQVAIVTSRAFASLNDFVTCSGHLLAPHGKLLAMKGQRPEQEIRELSPSYRVIACHALALPGTSAARHVLEIRRTESTAGP